MKKPQSKWNKHLMDIYHKMKSRNPSAKLTDAMKEAKKSYRR